MQKIVEFSRKNFWTSRVDLTWLNEEIFKLNNEGWVVKSMTPNTSFFGVVTSYSLLLELTNKVKS